MVSGCSLGNLQPQVSSFAKPPRIRPQQLLSDTTPHMQCYLLKSRRSISTSNLFVLSHHKSVSRFQSTDKKSSLFFTGDFPLIHPSIPSSSHPALRPNLSNPIFFCFDLLANHHAYTNSPHICGPRSNLRRSSILRRCRPDRPSCSSPKP